MIKIDRPAPWRRDRFLVGLVLAFLAGHLLLALLVPDGAARMLVGDRAGDRFRALTELLAQPDLDHAVRVVFRIGSPGDWILFTPVFALAGPYGVMAQNVVLYALGLVALYRLGHMLLPPAGARIACIAWCLLPATVFHPHALTSEAICNPLLIMLVERLIRLELAEDAGWRDVLIAGAMTGLIAFVRHVYLLLPLAVAMWLLLMRPQGVGRPSRIAAYLALGYALTMLWWAAIGLGGQRYPLGESVGGLESNLFLRADRMAAMGGLALPQGYLDRNRAAGKELRTMHPAEFAAFAGANPGLFVRSALSDAFNLVANPGVAMLAGRYLGLFDLGERNHRDLNKWRETREREGVTGLVRLLWQTSPVGLAFNLAGNILWAGFLGLALLGALLFVVDRHQTPAVRVLLAGFVTYATVLTSATAGYTRWDHRSGIEFILAIWFAIGLLQLVEWSGRRDSNSRLPAPK